MRRHFTRLLVCAAVAGSASLAMVSIPGSTAGATTQLTVVCTTLTGSTTSETASGCSGADVSQTGSKGTITPKVSGKSGTDTIKWTTGKTTTEKFTYTTGSDASCPAKAGYTKLTEATQTSQVTGGTATKLIGSEKFVGKSCEYSKSGKLYIFNEGKDTY
jgi:hypothetical protein